MENCIGFTYILKIYESVSDAKMETVRTTRRTFTMRVRDTNLQLFAKSGFDIVSSPPFAYDLDHVFLTNSQIHEIVFAVTGFINDGFQHALKKKGQKCSYSFVLYVFVSLE